MMSRLFKPAAAASSRAFSSATTKAPVRVAVTGSAGQIGYALLFRIANGEMLGKDQPVILHCIELPDAMDRLKGVAMELDDCAFPLLHDVIQTSDINEGFGDVDIAMLVGSRPRGPGMERGDLLQANGKIFTAQGKALNDNAKRSAKVIVVGNPANTNCLIAAHNAPNLDPNNFTAMTRLDHNRAAGLLAKRTGSLVKDIQQVCIWGNHSATQVPDISNATVNNKPAMTVVNDPNWVKQEFIPQVQQRGAAVIKARGSSSAASAANAALEHIRDWHLGTSAWTSMAVPSGPYDVPKGIYFSYPVTCSNGQYNVVSGVNITEENAKLIKATTDELLQERDTVRDLLS